jgi:uncharacterized damage-inducible protein DinB
MNSTHQLRTLLTTHLKGGTAFLPIDKFIYNIPYEKLGVVPDGLPYSLWQQFWHLMYAQKDIVEFSLDPDYSEPDWPSDYWPDNSAPESQVVWKSAIDEFFEDRNRLIQAVQDPSTDSFEPLVNDPSKNLLREVLLVIEHNAYHTGQILVIMRTLGMHH